MPGKQQAVPVGDLARALPKDAGADPTGRKLAELVAQIAHRKVPVSSFARVWSLGSLPAQVSMGYLVYWLRSRFAGDNEKQRLKSEAHLAAALKLFGTMGYLRGAVLKVGQMLATLPELLPEQFAEVLAALHFEAPPMHFSMVREVFLDEFGREPEEVFAWFERESFAAASLGQVHRARLKSGEEVAVKIQYPGIAGTIRTDLRNLRLLLQPISRGSDWENILDKLNDVEKMLLMETDYEQEAEFTRQARALFGAGEGIVVPRVYDDYSTKRVLTAEYLPGRHIEEYLKSDPSQEERDRYATLYTVATFRFFYQCRWIASDQHPGNLIMMHDGRLGIIDFGSTRQLSEAEWRLSTGQIEASLEGDDRRITEIMAESCLCTPEEMEPERQELLRKSFDWFMEPWLHEGQFDFGDREFFRRGIDYLVAMSRKGYTRCIPLALWTHRFTLGGRALAYRLKGRCEFRKIYLEEFAAATEKNNI